MTTGPTSAGNMIIMQPRHTTRLTCSGGAAVSGYPVTNLQWSASQPDSNDLSAVWRTPDLAAASTQVIGTFDAALPCNFFVLGDQTLSTPTATHRLRLYDDVALGGTNVYDTRDPVTGFDLEAWDVTHPQGSVPAWDPHFISGKYVQADLAGRIWCLGVLIAGAPPMCRSFLWEFFDVNNPAGCIQAGRLEVGLQWQVSYHMDQGMQFGAPARTLMQQAKGGGKRFEPLTKGQVYRGQIGYLPRDETMAQAFEQQQGQDLWQPFAAWIFPAEAAQKPRTLRIMRHTELGLFTHKGTGGNTAPFAFEDEL